MTVSDLIRREDAIVAVENNSYGMGSRASVKAIKALPSAEAVQGEWFYRWNDFECSACGAFEKNRSNFCPNCGTKMYKDGEDE